MPLTQYFSFIYIGDKLQFFHLKRDKKKQKADKPNLVLNTKSINSLITFTNNENIILNEPSLKNQTRDPECLSNDENDYFNRFSTLIKSKANEENFHYFPHLNNAPEIDLPVDLPDLPGIADDIAFTQDLIAPSLVTMNIVNDLPSIDKLMNEDTSNKKTQESFSTLELPQLIPNPPSIPINIPAPPPPPPPIPGNESIPKEQKLSKSNDVQRNSLMEAIRKAGGKTKLRNVPAADETINVVKKKATPPVGDLMGDLHAKLALRRRGIAGAKQAKKEKASSILDKVSSLIPPPSKGSDSDESSESDWD